ncbi:copper resistance CopC/CopD family protein [Devosia sp. RR2S18]|uniref:copper resistance CopC/CopD family protein n=1 Tax=Devosia rhizosphaerae TaxID=3049774 RepID=UPI0025413BD5|nr:CopD family protein [Devosia sp. RR2S18]WIJ26965.1 CopD family protein [Devosia sp. RR2S18]
MNQSISGAGLFRVRFRSTISVWIAAALLVLAISGSSPVQAHATLISTSPLDGAVLETAPYELILSFNEPVSPILARLVSPNGTITDLDNVRATASDLVISLPPAEGEGSFVLSWRAVSDDGHPISGISAFTVGAAPAAPTSIGANETDAAITGTLWVLRLVLFCALVFGAGGAAFRVLCWDLPPAAARAVCWSLVVGLAAVAVLPSLQGADLVGAGVWELVNPRIWVTGITSAYGITLILAAGALLVGLLALYATGGTTITFVAVLSLVLIGLALSSSGHASSADPRWLTRTALFLHVTSIAWWVGALFPLVLLLRQDRRTATPPLIRFSRYIPYAIVPLVASGLVLAILQLGPPSQAWLTPYGLVLAAKLLLLVILFAIASWNRWVLTAPAAAGEAKAVKHMRRGIAAEIVIILAVLGLVSVWRFTPPPRALADELAATSSVTLTEGDYQAILTLSPGRIGANSALIQVSKGTGELPTPRSVRLSMQPQDDVIAPVTATAEQDSSGAWSVEQLTLPLPGEWVAGVEVRVSDFELVKFEELLTVAP